MGRPRLPSSSAQVGPSDRSDVTRRADKFGPSGGHTAEMMRLLAGVNWSRYSTRTYIISSGDSLSEAKALELERSIGSGSVWPVLAL